MAAQAFRFADHDVGRRFAARAAVVVRVTSAGFLRRARSPRTVLR